MVPREQIIEGLRRYRELRAQLADDDPSNDDAAAAELEELRRSYEAALAEARAAEDGE